MATRQELFTAIGLIRQTCNMNAWGDAVILNLQGLGDYSEPSDGPPDGLTPFERQKQASKESCNIIYEISENLNVFLGKVDNVYLNNGINAISGPVTRLKIVTDVGISNTLSGTAKPFIITSSAAEDLVVLSEPFESYIPKCGVISPNPLEIFSIEIFHTNILHDLLDAMSYELRAKNSYNGQLTGQTVEQIKHLILERIKTAYIYYNYLPHNVEIEKMGDTFKYVEANLDTVKTYADCIQLSEYIDLNIPKLIMCRRWWAL